MTQKYDFDRPTFENHREHLMVPWVDPNSIPKQTTTFDDLNERLTVEDTSLSIG
jgi:hypothetical protein